MKTKLLSIFALGLALTGYVAHADENKDQTAQQEQLKEQTEKQQKEELNRSIASVHTGTRQTLSMSDDSGNADWRFAHVQNDTQHNVDQSMGPNFRGSNFK